MHVHICTHVHGMFMRVCVSMAWECVCIHICVCTCFSCFDVWPSRGPLGFWIVPLTCLFMSSILLSFLRREASQSDILNPLLGLCCFSGQPLSCDFGNYHLADVFWPSVSGPVTVAELPPQTCWTVCLEAPSILLCRLLPEYWNTGDPPGEKPHSPSVPSCLCSPPLHGQQCGQFCVFTVLEGSSQPCQQSLFHTFVLWLGGLPSMPWA